LGKAGSDVVVQVVGDASANGSHGEQSSDTVSMKSVKYELLQATLAPVLKDFLVNAPSHP
jgi:hypothetical protein